MSASSTWILVVTYPWLVSRLTDCLFAASLQGFSSSHPSEALGGFVVLLSPLAFNITCKVGVPKSRPEHHFPLSWAGIPSWLCWSLTAILNFIHLIISTINTSPKSSPFLWLSTPCFYNWYNRSLRYSSRTLRVTYGFVFYFCTAHQIHQINSASKNLSWHFPPPSIT